VLLAGDHGRIAAWRHDQSVRRTAARRPDLLHPSRTVGIGGTQLEVATAVPADAGELLTLQLACWVAEAQANPGVHIAPLHEGLSDVVAWMREWTTFVARSAGRLVGAARARLDGDTWDVGRLMVAPDLRGRGLGRLLLGHVEGAAPPGARRLALFTGAGSEANLRMYHRAGYRRDRVQPEEAGVVRLSKPVRRAP